MSTASPDDHSTSDLPEGGPRSPDGRSKDARVTLIVGGTSGIGLATARELAGRGDRLVLAAREGAAFAEARAVVADAGGTAETRAVDVLDRASVARLVEAVIERHGRLDAVINTAAVMAYGRIEDLPADVFEAVVDTAIHGTANLAREVLPVMRRQHRGVFVVINSLLGAITVPNMGAYATSKWGQRAVVRTLQQEVRDERDVHVCLASPGSINTPIYYQAFNRTGRMARPPVPVLQPTVPARVLADLLDRPRLHVTTRIGPANPLIIAGYRLLPRVYDAIVGPLFRVGALTRRGDNRRDNVCEPAPEQEREFGRWPERQR